MRDQVPSLTKADLEELIAFDEIFYPRNGSFQPVKRTGGGERDSLNTINMQYPVYRQEVDSFKEVLYTDKWSDSQYEPHEVESLISSIQGIEQARLAQIRSILTYIHRGERFCDGHVAVMIENGTVKRVLERLKVIALEMETE